SAGDSIACVPLTAAADPRPAAVIVLETDEVGHPLFDAADQKHRFGRLTSTRCQKVSQHRDSAQQIGSPVGYRRRRSMKTRDDRATFTKRGLSTERQLDEQPARAG